MDYVEVQLESWLCVIGFRLEYMIFTSQLGSCHAVVCRVSLIDVELLPFRSFVTSVNLQGMGV
jgi:hypothetical protein